MISLGSISLPNTVEMQMKNPGMISDSFFQVGLLKHVIIDEMLGSFNRYCSLYVTVAEFLRIVEEYSS